MRCKPLALALVAAPSRDAIVPAVVAQVAQAAADPMVRARVERIARSSGGLLEAVSPELTEHIRDLAQRALDER